MLYLLANFDETIQTLENAPEYFGDALQWGIDASYVYLAWCSLLALAVYFFKR